MRASLLGVVVLTGCAPVSIDFFTAEPMRVVAGASTQLSWSSTGATACRLTPGDLPLSVAGALTVSPATTTDYELRCGNATASVRVEVEPVRIVRFGALPVTASSGDLVTLAWESVGASRCTVTPPGREGPGSGELVTRVTSTQTFSLDCGGATASTTVAVTPGPGDPLFAQQWHLSNTGQSGGRRGDDVSVEAAWALVRGEGVLVSVVDDGVDLAHEDLVANANLARSHDYLGSATVDLAEHGTAVAGLIGARDENGLGGRGVAPRAAVASFNLLQDSTSANELDAMVRHLDAVQVSNNSWGDADDGTGQLTTADALWLMGVERGTREGRGGRGIVYLFPSGNGADGRYVDDSNFDGQANSRFVFAIGGVSDDGTRAAYAEGGANVLVSAPAGDRGAQYLVTTDVTGTAGYNTGRTAGEPANANYTRTFEGTSASTPLVAGVVALMLQTNPQLTWRDVRRVLARSARRNHPTHPDWSVNGAGLSVNHDYGFGVVNAAAAVQLAREFVAGAPEKAFSSVVAQVNQAIPDASATGVSNVIPVQGSGLSEVDVVEVTLTIEHPHSGDLEVRLEHEGGGFSRLHPQHACQPGPNGQPACSRLANVTFTSVRHLDEPGDGRWRLVVRDLAAQDVGRLVSWKVALFGR
ncbi:MAG: S8 family serine peptidase [Myxococcaceae bacterium]|nr:S8 family serine peptidase [Myxococcaceae bacterium]